MKKIVSMLAVAALALSSVFAADITAEYSTKGNIYGEKAAKAAGSKTSTVSTKEFLNQKGYDDDAASCITFTASGDAGGVCLDLDADARNLNLTRDQIYGWMNFGNIQLTTGAWTSRYVNRVKEDANKWANSDYEMFKPGIVCGSDGKGLKAAYDIDNLTTNATGAQTLATAIAYTLRPNEDTYLMVKGVAIEGNWGGTGRFDSDKKYAAGDYDIMFRSTFAGELAFRQEGVIDVNAVVKSPARDSLIAAVFVRPLMLKDLNLLVGGTYACDLSEKPDTVDAKAYAYGIDLRARYAVSENLAITTMNNLSSKVAAKAKGADHAAYEMSMWNMLSVAYKLSDALTLQVTGEKYAPLFAAKDAKGDAVDRRNLGASKASVLAGVVYKLNDNASFSGGIKYTTDAAFAHKDYKDTNEEKIEVSVPFVFSVAL